MTDMEKCKAEMLEDEDQRETDGEENAVKDPLEQLQKLCSGKLKLMKPIRAHGEDVKEIRFDFCGLSTEEMLNALDSVAANNMFAITNAQALALFAATAEKCAPLVESGSMKTRQYDAKDIKKRLSAADSVKAVQLAKLFYIASSQAGNNNISKE